jgi:hypothetical protein
MLSVRQPIWVFVCRHCGAPMIVIEILERTPHIRAPPMRRGAT